MMMHRSLEESPEPHHALAQITTWVRERFKLSHGAAIIVSEQACSSPGYPPVETVVAFWSDEKRHEFTVFKPVEEVVADDLPPAWMKNALVPDGHPGCNCC